jgi:diguanylate cyclase (GGDEF)-like protein/PAS domain S-box-containing protein
VHRPDGNGGHAPSDDAATLLRAIVDNTPDTVYVKDRAGRYLLINVAGAGVIGRLPHEIVGCTDSDLFTPEIAADFIADDRAVQAAERATVSEGAVEAPDGTVHTYMTVKAPYRDHAGHVAGIIGISRDVTDRKAAEAAVRTSEQWFRTLVQHSSDMTVVVNDAVRVLYWSPARTGVLGIPLDEDCVGDHFLDHVHPDDVVQLTSAFDAARELGTQIVEYRMRHRDGTSRYVESHVSNLLHDDAIRAIVLNTRDVTQRKQFEEQMAFQAFHDSLTGLANRALFRDRVEHLLRRHVRTRRGAAVLFLDLDAFKDVNDSFGHDAGDELLRLVSARLSEVIRAEDTIARLGGDEFAVLLEEPDNPLDEAHAVAERLMQALSAPFWLAGRAISVAASIGIAIADVEQDAAALLRNADIAMYRAKAAGKGRSVLYHAGMQVAVQERLRLETDLARALEDGQFRLVYQPVVDLETGQIRGFEALLRWHHPELGTLQPDQFIPVAEHNGLIVPIGAWVLQEATRTATRWLHEFPVEPPLTMAVNVSARQLASPEFVETVRAALQASGLPGPALVLEMTETVLVENHEEAARRLHELHNLGVRLAVDDFGTGYSSLSYLRKFPIDILKIDRSFVNTIGDRDQLPAIVRGLLDLGHTLELELVAEGIELEHQLRHLRDEHCHLGQGFLFARPLTPTDAEAFLTELSAAGRVTRPSLAPSSNPI